MYTWVVCNLSPLKIWKCLTPSMHHFACANWSVKGILSPAEAAELKSRSIHDSDNTTPSIRLYQCALLLAIYVHQFPTCFHFKQQFLHVGGNNEYVSFCWFWESFKKKSQMVCLTCFFITKKKKKTPINDRILRINILEWSLFFFSFKKKVKKLTYTFPEQQISLQVVAFIISKSRKGDLMSSETFFIKSCRHLASLQRPHWLWWTNTKANAVARFCILSVYQFPEWVVSTKC